MKLTRRFLALLLVLCLSLSLVTPAMATETETTEQTNVVPEVQTTDTETDQAEEKVTKVEKDETGTGAAGYSLMTASLEEEDTESDSEDEEEETTPAGTEDDPIYPEFTWNDANTEADATVTVPVGATIWFATYGSGMVLTINGEKYGVLESSGPRMPATFSITNNGDTDAEYVLHLEYPVGSEMNPAKLTLGANAAAVEEGSVGYFFSWTASYAGNLTITMGECAHGWFYAVNNITTGLYGDMHYSDDAEPVSSETISVAKGDEIQVTVATNEDWAVPAGTVNFDASFDPKGSETNPIYPEFTWNEDNTEADVTVTIPAETTQYFAVYGSGMDLYINGEYYGRLEAAGFRQPAFFSIPNKAKGEQEFALHLEYPAGSEMNPAELVLGANEAAVEEDSSGYFFNWTAPYAGNLTITMGECEHGWSYAVNNITTGLYGDMHYSDDADPVSSETITVAKGDEIRITVATNEDWAVPAGTVSFDASFDPQGSETNPIYPELTWNEDNTEADVTVTIPAETTQYFAVYGSGMDLYIDGEYYCRLEAAGFRQPAFFSIPNKAKGEQEFALHLEYPAGSEMNPTELVLGANEAAVEEDSIGYFFTWTAPSDGNLTITMGECEHGWAYSVSNITTGLYGDMHYSDDAEPVSSETISVAKGDEIKVSVATNEDWAVPAGTVSFDASFDPLGSETNPIYPELTWNEDYTQADVSVTIPAETTQYFAVYGSGMDLYINGEYYGRLEAAGFRQPAIFSIPNKAKGEQEFALHLEYPAGSEMNPTELVLGANEAAVEEDSIGYFFTWTAPSDGNLTITMGECEHGWAYSVSNITTGLYGDMHYSDDAEPVSSETISVAKGDEIRITVATNEDWAVPAGTVNFDASFDPLGSETNPIYPDLTWNEDYTQANATVTIPAETTQFFAVYASGMDLYINGEYYCRLESARFRQPAFFSITNKARGEQEFVLDLEYPVGNEMNPAELVMGINEAAVEEDSTGYFFTWTAPADGRLTITMGECEHGWFYVVNNITAGLYGDMHYSDDAEPVLSETISVAKGDEIQITVATNEDWAVPAGTVTFHAAFAAFNIQGSESLVAGKTTTLKAVNIETGKTQKVTWSVDDAYAPYASISTSGVLTAKKVAEPVTVVVLASAVVNGCNSVVAHEVTIYPAISKVDIKCGGTYVTDETLYLDIAENPDAVLELSGAAYPYGDMAAISWKSSNTKIATVADGKVTAVKAGTVTITCTAKDAAGTKNATVKVVIGAFAKNVTIGNVPESLRSGSYKTLTADVSTAAEGVAPTTAGVTWSLKNSADSAYVTLSASGKITAKTVYEKHTVTVVATSKDGKASAACTIDILPKATELLVLKVGDAFVTKTTLGVARYESVQLDAYVMDELGEVTPVTAVWTKSASDVILTVNNGLVTMNRAATVTITAKYETQDGKVLTATVKVKASNPVKTAPTVPVWYIDLVRDGYYVSGNNIVLAAGKSTTVKAEVNRSATDKTLTWSMDVVRYDEESDAYVVCEGEAPLVTVSSSGKITASKNVFEPQTVRITVTANSNPEVTNSFYVTAAPAAYAIRISERYWDWNEELGEGYQIVGRELTNTTTVWDMEASPWLELQADVYAQLPNVNQSVTWKSSSTSVARVYDNGSADTVVEFLKPGKVTITATATDGSGVQASFTLNVVKRVSSITLQDVNIAGGKSVTLKPVIGPSDATNKKLSWTLTYGLDENGNYVPVPATVATLSSSGKLTTKATNEIETVYVVVNAQDGGGCVEWCEVTIYPATKSVNLSYNEEAVNGKTITIYTDEIISLDALNLTADGSGSAYQGWTWKSSSGKVASVDEEGTVTALSAGSATITATAADGSGQKATVKIKVVNPVE